MPNRVKENNSPNRYKIKEQELPKKKTWVFSFKYYKQIKYFGLDKTDSKWFVSILEKFQELSTMEIDLFFKNFALKKQNRFHEINWSAKNVPVAKKDFGWIPQNILNNDNDFPFIQFQISKALGRVVGFFDIDNIFHIVVLDPLHNIQPSKDYNYSVNDCNPLSCEYTSLLKDIEDVKIKCEKVNCCVKQDLVNMPTKNNNTNAVLLFLDDEYLEQYHIIKEKINFSELVKNIIIENIES